MRVFVAVYVLLFAASGYAQQTSTEDRPNVVVIVVDDLRWDEVGALGHPFAATPNVDRLAREGMTFVAAYHAVPLCSPNRASILTGQYPSRHGITDNVARSLASHGLTTFPQMLQADGYDTAFIGKWHMGNDPTPRPGFDYWAALPGQGRSVDPEIYEKGELQVVEGYTTDILTERAVEFLEEERQQPFFVFLAHKAIHPDIAQFDDGSVDLSQPARYVPAPRHVGSYAESEFPERENVVSSPDALRGKPALQRALRRKYSSPMLDEFGSLMFDYRPSQDIVRTRAEMLLAVDDSVGVILATLERLGVLDTTAIIFTSDNGYWFGEHALSNERRLPYEEAVKMPLLLRYPPLTAAAGTSPELVSSIDIAPTVLEIAGVSVSGQIQGRSLLPLLSGSVGGWRDAVLIEFHTYENPMPWLVDMSYKAIRTQRHKYIHWVQHPEESELYDLQADPYEMTNVIDDAAYAKTVDDMQRRLEREIVRALGVGAAGED